MAQAAVQLRTVSGSGVLSTNNPSRNYVNLKTKKKDVKTKVSNFNGSLGLG